jgi:hypothetical protein
MGKLQRPLDPEAVEAADENLYAAHGSDPRPNALYDADGNQIPLDGSDPALNQEWEAQYNSALNPSSSSERVVGGGPSTTTKSPAPPFGNNPVGCATQQCAKTHWITIDLVKDIKDDRPKWWKKEAKSQPYPYEPFSAVITDGRKKGALDGSGSTDYRPIPQGSCSIQFTQFYKGIVAQLETGSFVPVAPLSPDEKAKKLVLTGIDSYFAPGVEVLNIKYDIHNLENDAVVLEIESSKAPGKILFQRELSADEKVSGDGKLLSWDGKANEGQKSGHWIGPEDSPYVVRLKAPSDGLEDEKQTRVQIYKIEIKIDAPKHKIILNVPETKTLATSKVLIKKKAGGGTVTPIDMEVVFSFTPSAGNVSAGDSFAYNPPKTLGKSGDASAVYWEPHKDHPSQTPDNYNKTCKAAVITTGTEQGKAKTWFKPSGVGGNKYKVKAQVFASDGTTSLAHKETVEVTIWRKIVLTPYEMVGQPHITTHGTAAIMAGYYKPDTYVEYELGKTTTLPAANSVKYIGLWDHASSGQLDWAKHSAKTNAEIPTKDETTDANGPPGQKQTDARKNVQAKANSWRDRLIKAYTAGMDDWAPDANVPINSIVAIEFEHPKYSMNAPNADSVTNEWGAFPWLRITVEGRSIHPDRRWVNGLGVSRKKRAYIVAGDSAASTEVTIAHEAGHETKNQFKRDVFGPDHDHSAAAGLMDAWGTRNAFTAREKEILRGHK